jgi:hypothetical protein
MKNLKTRFSEDLSDVKWQYLTLHAQKDTIIFVTKHFFLIEVGITIAKVGITIAKDDVKSVPHWISKA